MKNIVLLGDSILARTYQDDSKALIPRLREYFSNINITSYAVSGANSMQTLEQLKSLSIPQDSVFMISLGMNDAAPWKQIKLNDFISNYQQILHLLSGHPIVLLTPYPVDIHKQVPPGRDNHLLWVYSDKIMMLAREHGLVGLDIYSLIEKASNGKDLYVSDGVHLNDHGYKILFNSIEHILAKLSK